LVGGTTLYLIRFFQVIDAFFIYPPSFRMFRPSSPQSLRLNHIFGGVLMMKKLLVGLLSVVGLGVFAQFELNLAWQIDANMPPYLVGVADDEIRGFDVYDGKMVVVDRRAYAATPADNSQTTKRIAVYNIADGTPATPASLNVPDSVVPNEKYRLVEGMFADDGAFYACSLYVPSNTALPSFALYKWNTLSSDPVKILEKTDFAYRMGDAFFVKGSGNNTKIYVGANNAASKICEFSTADGTTWNYTELFTSKIQDLYVDADGKIWTFVPSETIIKKLNADGTESGYQVDATGVFVGSETATLTTNPRGLVIDEANGILHLGNYLQYSQVASYSVNTTTPVFRLKTDFLDITRGTTDTADDVSFEGNKNGTAKLALDEDGNVYFLTERIGIARFDLTLITAASTWTMFQ